MMLETCDIGQYLALHVYIGVRNAHMLEWQPHIHRLINFLPFCVQKANVSQFVENFKKSRLMLVHGTGDGECLSCVWTVLPTEQLVCGHENGLAVHSQATPLKNNLGIYISVETEGDRQTDRQTDRQRQRDVKKWLIFDKRTWSIWLTFAARI